MIFCVLRWTWSFVFIFVFVFILVCIYMLCFVLLPIFSVNKDVYRGKLPRSPLLAAPLFEARYCWKDRDACAE